jgi:hypothetical protein
MLSRTRLPCRHRRPLLFGTVAAYPRGSRGAHHRCHDRDFLQGLPGRESYPLATDAPPHHDYRTHAERASASVLDTEGLWHSDAIERQLVHVDNDSVRRAYARADY